MAPVVPISSNSVLLATVPMVSDTQGPADVLLSDALDVCSLVTDLKAKEVSFNSEIDSVPPVVSESVPVAVGSSNEVDDVVVEGSISGSVSLVEGGLVSSLGVTSTELVSVPYAPIIQENQFIKASHTSPSKSLEILAVKGMTSSNSFAVLSASPEVDDQYSNKVLLLDVPQNSLSISSFSGTKLKPKKRKMGSKTSPFVGDGISLLPEMRHQIRKN